jgi:hypothetical protein
MKEINKITLLLFTFFIFQIGFSQTITRSSIGSFGSSVSNDGITIQQTLGQPSLVTNEINEEGTGLRQGFQQPIYFEVESNELNATLFPNPNNGQFSFQAELEESVSYAYELYDQNGKLLERNTAFGNTIVPVSILNPSAGMYHLKLSSGNKKSAFKVNIIP